MLKKIVMAATVLTAVFLLVLFAGRSSLFVVESSARLGSSSAEIWRSLSDVEQWPAWWPGMQQANLTGHWQPGSVLSLQLRGDPAIEPAHLQTVEPLREVVWRRAGVLGSHSSTSWRLEPVPGGTMVYLKSSISGVQALLARATGRRKFGRYQQAVLAGLDNFLRRPAQLSSGKEKR